MVQASGNVREPVAFARRLACRTLTVIGGIAAGTAVAWWLASASASADPLPGLSGPNVPLVSDVADVIDVSVDPAVSVVSLDAALTTVGDHLSDPPSSGPLTEVGDRLEDTLENPVAQLGQQAAADVPDCVTPLRDCGLDLGRGAPSSRARHDDAPRTSGSGQAGLPSAVPAAVDTVAGAGVGVDVGVAGDRAAKDRAIVADGVSRRGSPDPVRRDLPTWPVPFAPALPAGPATGHGGQTGNSGADSHLFAALPSLDDTVDLVAGGSPHAVGGVAPGRVGAQPGVSPD